MLKALYQIDLFGKPVLFNYRGNSKSKSKVGAICTIILCGFIIWVTVYFGQQLLDTSNPKASSFESFNENPAVTPLSIDNFAFAIGMAHPVTYANYINDSIFTISATTYKTTRVPQADGTVKIDYEIVPLEMESCRPDHFGELNETFSYIALDQLYCLKKEQPNLGGGQPFLEGNWESPIFQGVFIDLLQCDRNVSGNNCGTQEEIDYLLKGGLLTLVFTNVAVDMTDANKPLKKFRDGWYTSVGNEYNKEINVYLEQLEINTDKGWLTNEFKSEKYVKYGEIREMFSLVKKSNYVHFVIRLSNVMKHFNRSYTKIQEIIAQVNGTVLVTFTILIIILAPYVRLKFYETLINDIFDIKMSKKNQKGTKTTKKGKKTESNSKDEDQKIKHQSSINKRVLNSNEDLEVQKSPSDLISTNRLGLMEGRDTDGYDLLKGATLESCPTKPNFTNANALQRQSSKIKKANKYLKADSGDESKLKLSFSQSRGISGMPLNISGFQSEIRRGDNCDLTIPVSSRDSKPEKLLTPRKPTFVQPNFKILDYEEHGQDLLEDILKNIERDDKDPLGDLAMTQIRSDEREKEDFNPQDPKLTRDNNKDDLSQMLRSNEDEEKERAKPEHERGVNSGRNHPTSVSLQKLDLITSKKSDQINLSFGEYLRSFVSRSDVIKNKMAILNEGISRINERLDIFNVFKKLREFDKLKVLLLENEQFVLFHSLPRPELALKENEPVDPHAPTNIKDPQFIQDKLKKDLILRSYQNIKQKKMVTMLDNKLLEIYDEILCVNSPSCK